MLSHLVLQKKNNLSESVTRHCDPSGFEFLIIEHEKFNAAFALHGAHLLHFQPKDQEPIIWLSKTALFNEQKAIRGGVPICWPWFGAAEQALGNNLPAHGFARTSQWSIKNINESADAVEIELLLKDSAETRRLWPFEFELLLKATLSDSMKLELISSNTGTQTFSYGAALHTYLNISAPESCLITGLSKQYKDKLNAGKLETADTNLKINGPIDAIYQKSASTITLADHQFNRQLNILNSGNDSEVLWTPWVEGAQAFADMPDDGYRTMLCIESAITDTQGVTVEPGQSHALTTLIK